MSQILKLTHENQQLKRQISQYKQVLGVSPYVDDSLLKGGYRVVNSIQDRDKIDCCHRKQGMKVVVIGNDFSYKEYVLKSSNCKTNQWEEVDVIVNENEVFLIEDYSELGEDLDTQRDLNLILKQILQNLQTQIDNIELTDEKVQITENTGFAQVGENQKIFNRNVAATVQTQGNEIFNLKGITFEMDIPNQKLILLDRNSVVLTEVSVAFLNDEARHLEYDGVGNLVLKNEQEEVLSTLSVASFINQIGKSLQLDGYILNLLDENNNILSSVTFEISSILGLETALEFINDRLANLEGLNYTWSPTNRTLTLYDNSGNQLSQVSLQSLDNEGTDLRYNASTLSLELYNADNELLDSIPITDFVKNVGTQLQLNSNQLQLKDSQGNVLSTVSFSISNISGLQTALDGKMNIPSGINDNQVPKYSTTSSTFIGSVIYDNGTNVGIGTSTPSAKLDVAGIIKTNSAIDFTQISRWSYFGTGANRMYVTDANMLVLNDGSGNQRLVAIIPYNSQQLYSKAGMPVVGTANTNTIDFSTAYGTAGSKLWVGDNPYGDANIIFDVFSNAMNKTSRPFPFVSGNWFYTMVGILGNMVFQIDGDAGVYFFSGAKWEKLGREYLTKRTDLSVIDTEAENEKTIFASKSTYTTTELNAVKQLIYSLKLNNLWQKMEFIYPMIGGTLDSCSKDLISSNNNSYNITWYNTSNLIVSSLGIKSADVTSNIGYGDTNFIPSVSSVFGSEGYTFVLGDTTANRINYVFGSQAGGTNRTKISSWGHLDISGTCYYYYSGTSNTPKGIYTQQRDVSSCASIFNGSNKYIERYYNNSGGLTNSSIYILSMNGLTSDSSISCKDRLQFCCKHKSLSMSEVQTLKSIIDTFEQSLGRKTW